jgi:hypothetical protein
LIIHGKEKKRKKRKKRKPQKELFSFLKRSLSKKRYVMKGKIKLLITQM